jgi:hypothetical protein
LSSLSFSPYCSPFRVQPVSFILRAISAARKVSSANVVAKDAEAEIVDLVNPIVELADAVDSVAVHGASVRAFENLELPPVLGA